MSTLELKIYEIFKARFSEQEAASVIEYFEQKAEQKYNEKKDVLATKEDIGQLRKEIEASKSDIVKWMFIFWIGQMAAIFGLIIQYLKK